MTETDRSFRIAFLLIDGFALMSYAAATEPLRAANLLAGRDLYEIVNIPASGAAATSSGGAMVTASGGQAADMALVVAGGDPLSFASREVERRLRSWDGSGVTLGGISGGPAVLAALGLMDGRRMTVHWEHAAALAERAPEALIERTLYVIDRDRVTCAGGTAPMDMMHALIAHDHGADFARRVSDWFLHTEIRPSGGPQRAGLAARYGVAERAVLDALEMMESHLADPLSLDQLARVAAISPRQLSRLFAAHMGASVMAFYRRMRLDRAHDLLTTSPLTLTETAAATGFAGPAHFSRCYKAAFGRTPGAALMGEQDQEDRDQDQDDAQNL